MKKIQNVQFHRGESDKFNVHTPLASIVTY